MTYKQMRELFRQLAQLNGRYSVTDAFRDGADVWAVGVMVRRKYAYRFTDLGIFEQKFPHLLSVYEEPRLYAPDTASLSWLQALYILGWAERAYPRVQIHGLLQNGEGLFEVAVSRMAPGVEQGRRSGLHLLHSLDQAERLLAA